MSESKSYTMEELLQELQPPYADQAHLANILNTLAYHFERPWREETPAPMLTVGFTPILGQYLELSEDAREELLACLCQLYEPYSGQKLDLDLSIIKDNLQIIAPSGLISALSLISDECAPDAEARIQPYLTHEKESVREVAEEELEELASVREFHRRRSEAQP